MTDEMVTEILPLHTLNAPQLVKDLDPLIPRNATVTANEAGNAIIMTAQRKDVRRIDQLISDLDGSAISDVEVSVLQYADAKSVAAELKEIFQTPDSGVAQANARNQFRGGGRFGAMAASMGMSGGGGGGEEASKNVQTHALFVSDDQMNAVISSAPPDYMRMITNIIALLDKPSQDITVLRLFHLKHADAQEVSDELSAAFPSSSTSADQNNRTMGMRFMPPWMQQQPAANSQSSRMKRETTVTVVPDRRTQAVLVSASKDMMEQIDGVIKGLDEGGQGVQTVKVLDIGAADPATVETVLAGLFAPPNRPSSSSTLTETPLTSRYTGNANTQSSSAQSLTTGNTTGGTGSTGLH
jgi:type II secretory pathway component GspD/PulD (secretin)